MLPLLRASPVPTCLACHSAPWFFSRNSGVATLVHLPDRRGQQPFTHPRVLPRLLGALHQAKQINDSAHGDPGPGGTGQLTKRSAFQREPGTEQNNTDTGTWRGGRGGSLVRGGAACTRREALGGGAPEPATQRSEGSIAGGGAASAKALRCEQRDLSREQEGES